MLTQPPEFSKSYFDIVYVSLTGVCQITRNLTHPPGIASERRKIRTYVNLAEARNFNTRKRGGRGNPSHARRAHPNDIPKSSTRSYFAVPKPGSLQQQSGDGSVNQR